MTTEPINNTARRDLDDAICAAHREGYVSSLQLSYYLAREGFKK